MTNVVSEISINNIIIGKVKSKVFEILGLKIIGTEAIANPRNIEPASPKNILAGALLYTKNPAIENINIINRINGIVAPNLL